ncbi:hypothetical protein FGO68_gene14574 [Halteria grandinella]|uniref:Uncharacterized protein n=1 Tax=Halteria grandinella TaxID=5974 RepID=A0A8J8T110_HALGN|nr:hypothetical protein FGO68_gene14574 [Halteria grandinella]
MSKKPQSTAKQVATPAIPHAKLGGPSAFKLLFSELLTTANADFSLLSKDYRKPLKCYVKESYPHFLVTDGYFFVEAAFTKEAYDEFRVKYGSAVKISQLADKVIVITSWVLDIRINGSEEKEASFTSYAGVEVRLVIESFKPNLQERLNPTRYPVNLFRDDEMKTVIRQFRHQLLLMSTSTGSNAKLPDFMKIEGGSVMKSKLSADCIVLTNLDEVTKTTVKAHKGGFQLLGMKEIADKEALPMEAPIAVEVKKQVPKVTGGAKKVLGKKVNKASAQKEDVKRIVSKVMQHTAPTKTAGKASKGKQSASKITPKIPVGKRSAAKAPNTNMPLPSEAGKGKNSKATTDNMSMTEFKKYLEWHEQKKKGGAAATAKSPGTAKRSKK